MTIATNFAARRTGLTCLGLACLLAFGQPAIGQQGAIDDSNDKYATFWTAMYDQAVTFNFGPTGAEGWFQGDKAYVSFIQKHSPAFGRLCENDTIIGANGKLFPPDKDARIALGDAITEAETARRAGKLELIVLQQGERKTVALPLRVMGSYSPTWPLDCEKSAKIIDRACEYLAENQLPNGHFPSDEEIGTPMAGLLFLAGGDARYLDNARRAAYWIVDNPRMTGMMSWPWGYDAVFLAEYYLATGDRNILPGLKDLARRLQSIQAECGSWGHGIPGGYGTVNATGLICFQGLILTKECGLAVDEAVLKRSINMFRRFAGCGHVPYGDHPPYRGRCAGNGKDGMAAVNFTLLGGYEKEVAKFIQTVSENYPYVETGHTGCYFSFFWNSIAVAAAPEPQRRRLWDHWRWYYELSRTWDGGMVGQPYLGWGEAGMKYRAMCTPSTTGGMAMFYALGKRSLRILGKAKGPFGAEAPASLQAARALYDKKDWPALTAALDKYVKGPGRSAADKHMAERMRAAAENARKDVEVTLARAARHIKGSPIIFKGIYECSEWVKSVDRYGAASPELDKLKATIAENTRWVDEGRRFADGLAVVQDFNYRSWYRTGWQAKAVLGERHPPTTEVGWTTVMDLSADKPRQWRYLPVGKADNPAGDNDAFATVAGWYKPDFDDSAWKTGTGPAEARAPKNATPPTWAGARHLLMRGTFTVDRDDYSRWQLLLSIYGRHEYAMVYVNGHKVAEVVRRTAGRGGYAIIPLAPVATELFKKGQNHIAVYGRSTNAGHLDVGLQAKP